MPRTRTKHSSRVAARFFWRIEGEAKEFLQELANLRDDGIVRFQQKYQPSFDDYEKLGVLDLRDELRTLWTGGKQISPTLASVWDEGMSAGTGTPINEFICNRWLRAGGGGLLIQMGEIQPDIRRPLALLAYCTHLCFNKMRVCGNEGCPAPYFVARKGDQRFCSIKCGAPTKRASKLRSWRKNKNKWPSQLKRRKGSRTPKRLKRGRLKKPIGRPKR